MNKIGTHTKNTLSTPTMLEKKQSIGPVDNRDFLSSFPEYGFTLAEISDAWP